MKKTLFSLSLLIFFGCNFQEKKEPKLLEALTNNSITPRGLIYKIGNEYFLLEVRILLQNKKSLELEIFYSQNPYFLKIILVKTFQNQLNNFFRYSFLLLFLLQLVHARTHRIQPPCRRRFRPHFLSRTRRIGHKTKTTSRQ